MTHIDHLTAEDLDSNHDDNPELTSLLGSVRMEIERATAKFGPFNSSHEGYAILKEEVDELWDEVKGNNLENARAEATQVAAMAVRFLLDVKARHHMEKPAQ